MDSEPLEPTSREQRLHQVLEAYLRAVEAGQAPDRQELLARHPDLAEELAAFLDDHEQLQRLAAPLRPAPPAPPRETAAWRTGGPAEGDVPVLAPVPGGTVRYIGDYELLGELGRGGMGVVYQARQLSLQRLVALKMMLAGSHAGQQDLARFRSEMEAAARLQHPNVVQIHEVGEHQGLPYAALEYVEGGSLDRLLRGTPLPARQAARLLEVLAGAVEEAHRQGVVHRDLKPGNVLLAPSDRPQAVPLGGETARRYEPKIADFGLAKLVKEEAGQTRSGAILGTPPYMAPEQAVGRAREAGPAADIYALGAILYEVLTGRPPFRAETSLDTLLQVVSQEPVPPRQLQPKVPRDLETICLKCLQKDPRRRYPSASALAEDLRRFLEGRPILARPVGPLERCWRWCRRSPAVATLAAAVVVLLLGGTLVSTLFALHASDSAAHASRLAQQNQEIADREHRARQDAEAARRLAEEKGKAALTATEAARRAEAHALAERNAAIHQQYIAHTHHIQDAWDAAAFGPLHDLLGRWLPQEGRPDPRGWEWGYLRRQCDGAMQILHGHGKKVTAASWHPDGLLLASASLDRTVKVWDARTGRLVRTCLGHRSDVYRAVWSPDGGRIASCGLDGAIIIWDAATGQAGHHIEAAHDGRIVDDVSWNPEGTLLASVGRDGRLRIWDAWAGLERHALGLRDRGHSLVAWSPDGSRVATTRMDAVSIWETKTWKQAAHWEHPAHQFIGTALAWGPDSRRLATANLRIAVWDTDSGQRAQQLFTRAESVLGLAWDAQAGLAAAYGDHTVRVWDPENGTLTRTLHMHAGIVSSVAWSPDHARLASAGDDLTVRVYDAEPVARRSRLLIDRFDLAATARYVYPEVAWLSQGRQLLAAGQLGVTAWDADTGGVHYHRDDFRPEYWSALADAPGRLALLSRHGQLVTLDPARGTILARCDTGLRLVRYEGSPLAFHPDGTRLAAGHKDTIQIRDAEGLQLLHTLRLKGVGNIWRLSWHPGGDRLAVCGQPSVVQIVDLKDGSAVSLRDHTSEVSQVAFSPDGRLLASAASDSMILLWDARTGKRLRTIAGHTSAVRALAWSPDGRRLASGSKDGTLRLWDPETGEQVLLLHGPGSTPEALRWDPTGARLASAHMSGEVRLWEGLAAGE